jgi:tetratricopeptide (TPR) repeat protein
LAYRALAFAHLSKRNFEKALFYSEQAIKYRPDDPYVLAHHGFIHCAKGDAKTGLPFAQQALQIAPF